MARKRRSAHKSTRFAAFALIATLIFVLRKMVRRAVKRHRARVVASEPFPYLASVSPRIGRQIEEMRFLAGALPAETIERAMGRWKEDVREPVRVYASLASGASVHERVDYAMEHLVALRALDRRYLLVVCPTGPGYVHPVVPEGLELASLGNCATVAVQYHDDRAVRAARKLDIGADALRLLLERINEHLASQQVRPKILVYGESLGAWAAQEGLFEASDTLLESIDGAAFVGTPYASKVAGELAQRLTGMGCNVVEISNLDQLPPDEIKAAYFANEDDPVSYFTGMKVLWRPQPWVRRMGKRWVPGWTLARAIMEIEAVTRPKPGVREATGHDYRAISPALVRRIARIDLDPTDTRRVETFLDEHERTRRARMAFLHAAAVEKTE